MAKHNETGAIGEMVAAEFLESKGHQVIDRNFRRPYGELDIVSRESRGRLHFVEVKSVSHETGNPEENIHPQKVARLKKIIQTYLSLKRNAAEWQFDVVAVFLDHSKKTARVRYTQNIILE